MRLTLNQPTPDGLLGLWTDAEATSGSDVTPRPGASVAEEDEEEEVVWVVGLPDGHEAAAAMLATARTDLRDTHERLTAVPEQLEERLATYDRSAAVRDVEVVFGTTAADGDVEQPSNEISRGVAALRRLAHASRPTAWVETRCGEQLVARSRTTLAGTITTVFLGRDLSGVDLHQEALILTASSRRAALETTALTLRGAVAIAARLSLPGGPLLALPLAWQLIQRLVEPARRK